MMATKKPKVPRSAFRGFTSLGIRLSKLGAALQKPGTKFNTLLRLSRDCGLSLQFVIHGPSGLSEAQWKRFLSVAFRHCTIKGDVSYQELQQGLNAAMQEKEPT